jgi:Pentapeptide repeats (8 copies)
MSQSKQRQGLIFILAAILTGGTLIAGIVIYMGVKNFDTSVTPKASPIETPIEASSDVPFTQEDLSIPPVETSVSNTQKKSEENVSKKVTPIPLENKPKITSILIQENEPGKNLGGVNWQGRDLRKINLRSANMGGANLVNANLNGVNLNQTNLSGSNLTKANLKNANLSDADLRGANLSNADLTGANLNGTLLDGANLNGTIMP